MFINIKSDYSTAEIERILSSKRNVKYMRKYVDYDLGINWVSHRKNLLCLFYNFGTKDKHGYHKVSNKCCTTSERRVVSCSIT